MTGASGSSEVPGPRTDGVAEALSRVGEAVDLVLGRGPGTLDAVDERERWTAGLAAPLPLRGIGADATLDELATLVVPYGTRLADPGFWGWITTGPTTLPLAAAAAASAVGGQRYTVTAFNLLEEQALDWLRDLCGLPEAMKGVWSSGGSVANLVALGAARQHAYEQRGIDPAADGTAALVPAVYASAEVHHTVQRAAGVLGLGRRAVRLVPVDERGRLDVAELRRMLAADAADGITPVAVVATAGTTSAGAIDPLRAAGEAAREHGAWFHVDGAYGLPGILDDRVADRYDGLELADSAIVDPHKWLNAPVGVAATFVRDRSLLHRAFTQEPADYLESIAGEAHDDVAVSIEAMGVPYQDMALELSSPPRGVVVWSILRELGREGVRARVRADNDLAARLAAAVRADERLELLLEPELSIVLLRYVGDPASPRDAAALDRLNLDLLQRLHRETPWLPSDTRVRGAVALRPCFINPRTTPEMVDAFAAAVRHLGDELASVAGS